ncbi:Thioredoxin-like protein [Corchorus olitorius]|uniref:Thioredoxin-like protein n=1 Tax=Corchorus olitorius TaxID=93759 RepID=A0A1R3IZU0_9ROSI|nr:Thioredoxin-like protein [Corchorus olitorius]
MSLLYWILILNLSILQASASPVASRTLLGETGGGGGSDPKEYAVELDANNFDGVLNNTSATFAIVEFYAQWCPACRNYKPHYEKVARLFNGPDAVNPGIILMTRIDCALKINTKLCDKFSVSHYPMLFWGPTEEFVSATGWEPNQAKSEICIIDNGRTAERLVNWINNQIGSSYSLDDENVQNKQLIQSKTSDPEQIAVPDYVLVKPSPTSFDTSTISGNKMIKWARGLLIKLRQLLAF